MTSGFDDHATIMSLEFLVKRLVVANCLKSTNPVESLARWSIAMKTEEDLFGRIAFNERASKSASLNAIAASAELKRMRDEIAADFRAAHEASPLHPL